MLADDIPILLQEKQDAGGIACLKMLKQWKHSPYGVSAEALLRSLGLPRRDSTPGLQHLLALASKMKLPLRHSRELSVDVLRQRMREQRPCILTVYSGAYPRPYPDSMNFLGVRAQGNTIPFQGLEWAA